MVTGIRVITHRNITRVAYEHDEFRFDLPGIVTISDEVSDGYRIIAHLGQLINGWFHTLLIFPFNKGLECIVKIIRGDDKVTRSALAVNKGAQNEEKNPTLKS